MKYITVSHELESAVRNKMLNTIDICRNKYSLDIPLPVIKFRQLGRRAGVCRFDFLSKTGLIVINPDFFKNHYDDMLNDTVPHEVAHHVSAYVYGPAGHNHGHFWKGVMQKLGIPAPDRCHEYSLEGVKVRNVQRPYKYVCGCSTEHNFTEFKHKRHQQLLMMGYNGYRCKHCKVQLKLEISSSKEISVPRFIQQFNVPTPKPLTITEPESKFKTITKFVNGMLINVKVPLEVA
jgi:SprT protein